MPIGLIKANNLQVALRAAVEFQCQLVQLKLYNLSSCQTLKCVPMPIGSIKANDWEVEEAAV